MNFRGKVRALWKALVLLLVTGLSACGSDGTTTAGGGSGGTGIGPVSGFGSVIVNGVRYATDNANIVIGGAENRPEADLKVGMRVRVAGAFSATDNSGKATRIEAIREVLGPVDDNGVDNVLNRLRVAGQTILVDPATIFDNVADLLELQAIQSRFRGHPGVEVQGAADDNGFLHATYIRKGANDFPVATDNTEVRGKITGLDTTGLRFLIGSLPVSYSGSGLVKVNWPITGLGNGLYVEVKGKITAAGGTGTLIASRIEVLDNAVGGNNDPVRVEGYIVSGTSKNSFVLLGPGGKVTVDGIGATLVPSGGTIGPGRKVQVEGAVTGTVLKASVIRIRPPSNIRMEGVGGQPDLPNQTFQLLSKTVRVDGYTRFRDDDAGSRTLGLSTLFLTPSATDNVEVVGSFDGTRVDAILVERIVPDEPGLVLLQGPVDNQTIVPGVSFDIVGIRVTSVRNFGNTEFEDASGNPVDMPTFFADVLPRLGPDQVVKVKRGVFLPGFTPLIRDDDATGRMEVEIEQVND